MPGTIAAADLLPRLWTCSDVAHQCSPAVSARDEPEIPAADRVSQIYRRSRPLPITARARLCVTRLSKIAACLGASLASTIRSGGG